MTTIKQRKEYIVNGQRLFVEQYQDKEMKVALWRYGELTSPGRGHVIKDGLLTRPNVKRLFGNK